MRLRMAGSFWWLVLGVFFLSCTDLRIAENQEAQVDSMGAGLSTVPVINGRLKKNQIVITIDESPHYAHSEELARVLAAKNVEALFFVVGERVVLQSERQFYRPERNVTDFLLPRRTEAFPCRFFSRIDSKAIVLPDPDSEDIFPKRNGVAVPFLHPQSSNFSHDRVNALVKYGHRVANHSFSHPIKGGSYKTCFNPDGLGFGELSVLRQAREIIWTHKVIEASLRARPIEGQSPVPVTYDASGRSPFYHWFRPSGGSFSSSLDDVQTLNEFVRFVYPDKPMVGPVLWSVPTPGQQADWQCRASRLGNAPAHDPKTLKLAADRCAEEYYAALKMTADSRGVILFHAHLVNQTKDGIQFYFSLEMIQKFIELVREDGIEIVPPHCVITGC